jgi:hypothetical protein
VILRGEVENLIRSDLGYLEKIEEEVQRIISKGKSTSALEKVSIESCGKSRIPLNGFVSDLHQANLLKLYEKLSN